MAEVAKILKQVEYYFGDNNLPKDKFLLGLVKESEEGWVPISKLLTFNRLKALASDPKIVADAVANSTLLEVNKDNEMIRRVTPLPDEVDTLKSSAYVKGFPKDYTLDKLEEFFAPYATIKSIRMRRDAHRAFKGSVFIELASEEDANNFAKNTFKVGDTDLIVMTKPDYLELKAKERGQRKPKAVEEPEDTFQIAKNSVLHLTNLPVGFSREDLVKTIGDEGVAFVDHMREDTHAHVRYNDAEAAAKAFEKIKDNLKVGENVVTVAQLSGEAEEQYIKQVIDSRNSRFNNNKGRKAGNNRGGRGGAHKRRAEEDSGSSSKVSKDE